ncbi:MAG: TRAM domain-containing protein [Victivallaceae bacterium]|nr:TRAM domain-containing protein [Victivallaceae bacterium]
MRLSNKLKLEIETLTFGGSGLGRLGGKVCFVPRALPGEVVEAEICKEKPDYCTARLLKVLKPAPERIPEVCPYGTFCPGCAYQQLDYGYENELKDRQMRDFLGRSLPLDGCEFGPPLAPENPFGCRNKLVLHVEKSGPNTALGYLSGNNQTVLDVPQCLLAGDAINEKLAELRRDNGFFHSLHPGQTLTLRYTRQNGVICWRNAPPAGMSWLKEELPFGEFSVPAGSFHQVNTFGAAALVDDAAAIFRRERPETVVDVYCGSGLFGVTAAVAGVPEIIGIELDVQAAAAARYNLSRHGAARVRIVAADAGETLARLAGKLPESALLVVDPPRGGLDKKAKTGLVRSKLKRLIYVSCGPDTLGRDLKMLHNDGFDLKFARMINMFPRTSHFEIFSYLTRD